MTDEPDGGRPAADPAELRFQAALMAALRGPAADPDAPPPATLEGAPAEVSTTSHGAPAEVSTTSHGAPAAVSAGFQGAPQIGPPTYAVPMAVNAPSSRRRMPWGRAPDPAAPPAADWAWVEEWREGDEPTPWGPGLTLAGFAALIIGIAVYVISEGLSDRPWIAVIANVVVAAGLAPALWMSRQLPVLRWVSLGGAVGTVVAWISVLFFPNF